MQYIHLNAREEVIVVDKENKEQLEGSVRRIAAGTGLQWPRNDTERDPCECPHCGSTASSVQIKTWATCDGHADGVIAAHVGATVSGIMLCPDEDAPPHESVQAVRLYCEDCGSEYELDPRLAVLVHVRNEE